MKVLEQLKDIEKKRFVRPWYLALTYMSIGDQDKAIKYLNKGYEIRDDMIMLRVEPLLRPLHANPRYQAIVRKMNFPEK